jgi:hypothetical protein
MAVNNHIRGSRVVFEYRVNNVPQIIKAESIQLEENADEFVDEVNGEDAGRPGIISDFWTATLKEFTGDLQRLDTWLAEAAIENAGLAELNKSANVRFNLSNGTSVQYVLSECCRSPITVDASGRKTAVMTSYKIRARRCKKVGS